VPDAKPGPSLDRDATVAKHAKVSAKKAAATKTPKKAKAVPSNHASSTKDVEDDENSSTINPFKKSSAP
jgi:hypothetical protein